MVDTVVPAGTTLSTRLDMSGTDTLTVEATGLFSVSANNQTVRFTGPTTGAIISNSGTIENTAGAGRAVRFETGVGNDLTATINNLTASSIIQSADDALQIQDTAGVSLGQVTIGNVGSILSTSGQAIDFAATTGTFIAAITNSGTVGSGSNDAIRFGAVGNVTNSGIINGGTDGAYSGADGLQYEDNATGTVANSTASGQISGDRHGINAGEGSNINVTNNAGATITGRNGSGIGSDGSATVTNHGTITGAFSDSPGSDVNGPLGEVPDGVNDGDGDGVDIDFQATIDNFGTIQGTGAGGHGSDGLPNTSEGIAAGGGTITNHTGGTISGLGLGILIDDSSQGNAPFLTTVVNQSGATVTGTNGIAIKIVSDLADVIDNAGTISGGGGTAIEFGTGDNTLRIRNGSTIDGNSNGGDGSDLLDYQFFTTSGVVVNLAAGAATGTDGVTNFENVVGSAGIDNIMGNAASNNFLGLGGDDTMDGGDLADTLNGGAGDDVLTGGAGSDTFRIAGSQATDDRIFGNAGTDKVEVLGSGAVTWARFVVSWSIETWDGNGKGVFGTNASNTLDFSTLTAATGWGLIDGKGGDDRITGSKLAEELFGKSGDDTLSGGGGADTLTGGTGRDVLSGGAKRDIFDFNALGEGAVGSGNRDQILDFQRGTDDIDLRSIDAKTGVSGNNAFKFIGTDSFNKVKGELRYIDLGPQVIVQGDVNGNGKADFEILVKAGALAAGDFLL